MPLFKMNITDKKRRYDVTYHLLTESEEISDRGLDVLTER